MKTINRTFTLEDYKKLSNAYDVKLKWEHENYRDLKIFEDVTILKDDLIQNGVPKLVLNYKSLNGDEIVIVDAVNSAMSMSYDCYEENDIVLVDAFTTGENGYSEGFIGIYSSPDIARGCHNVFIVGHYTLSVANALASQLKDGKLTMNCPPAIPKIDFYPNAFPHRNPSEKYPEGYPSSSMTFRTCDDVVSIDAFKGGRFKRDFTDALNRKLEERNFVIEDGQLYRKFEGTFNVATVGDYNPEKFTITASGLLDYKNNLVKINSINDKKTYDFNF